MDESLRGVWLARRACASSNERVQARHDGAIAAQIVAETQDIKYEAGVEVGRAVSLGRGRDCDERIKENWRKAVLRHWGEVGQDFEWH